jgi:Ca2+-transporting ATPase
MQKLLSHHWHQLPAGQVAELLETNVERGLDLFELNHRRERFGSNQLTPRKGRSPWMRFLLQFHNPLIYILLAAGLIKLAMGGFVDATVILAVVLVNAWIGYFQEAKAERAIEALSQGLIMETTVIRAGQTQRVNSVELVPGDVVLLSSGDKVPADLRLVSTRDLQLAEATLTGESTSVAKDANLQLSPETPLADRANMAYASTLVTYGQGRGIVTSTGDQTELGRISELISGAQSLETPLTRKMAMFSHKLLLVILGLTALVIALGWWRGGSLDEIVSSAIALAVGAIPEGLPAAVTVTLAIGVARMARRRAIIRKLPAVETLGSTTVICTDKTGTLTQNQMMVRIAAVGDAAFELSGKGYEPQGEITLNGQGVTAATAPGLTECLGAGLLCSDSALVQIEGRWEAQGDPTEVALIVAARKAGLDPERVREQLPRVDVIPFESQHQFMATLHSDSASGKKRVYMKGAVEVVLERCTMALGRDSTAEPIDRKRVHAQVEELSAAGLRVLAFARVALSPGTTRIDTHSLPRDFTLLGLQGMIDPPRPEALEAVRACHRAGVRVKMITGDHPGTALAIGRELNLVPERVPAGHPAALSGRELAALSDVQLIEAAEQVSVFARVTPEQKLRLVEALQARGHVVAMTGDGVNDGPALKQADIGVAMGITGTEVAKEAADMVLTDDNFASIEAAVEEGRNVFDNLRKIITWALPSNLGQGLVILAAATVGVALPILPLQVLWINMTTGGVLGLFLALEPKERDIMDRPPRSQQDSILSGPMLVQVTVVGLLILAAAFGLFRWELARGAGVDAARTVALNTVAMIQAFYLVNCRSLHHTVWSIGLFRTVEMLKLVRGAIDSTGSGQTHGRSAHEIKEPMNS